MAAGADIAVQSTHKTLSSLTQASMLHMQGGRVSQQRLQLALSLLQARSQCPGRAPSRHAKRRLWRPHISTSSQDPSWDALGRMPVLGFTHGCLCQLGCLS